MSRYGLKFQLWEELDNMQIVDYAIYEVLKINRMLDLVEDE